MHTINRHEISICGLSLVLILLAMIQIGCSSGKNPTMPSANPQDIKISSGSDDYGTGGEVGLGVFDLVIPPDISKAEIIPVRGMDAYGDSWFSDVTNYFRAVPCRDCLKIRSIGTDVENHIVVSLSMKHPYEPGDQSQPPTAKNRDDLRVFDTKLIAVTKDNSGPTFSAFNKRLSSNILVYPDGYTDMIDEIYDQLGNKPDDTHPYMILGRDFSEGNVNPSSPTGFTNLTNATGHNVMSQGYTYVTDVVFDTKPGETHQIRLFLTASYGISARNYLERLQPRYYLPEYNSKEAWRVEATDESDSLGPGYTESMAEVLVKVWDWQHDAIVDPSLSSLNRIRSESDVKSVDITVPGLMTSVVSDTKPDPGGTGKGDTPLEYRLEIFNDLGAPAGTYPALVRVVDEREPGGNTSTPEDGIWNSGYGLIPFDVPGFRTYQYFEFQIIDFWSVHPVGKFTLIPGGDPLVIGRDEQFDYDASESYDVDGGINSYEWDFDYDRTTFDPEPGHNSYTGSWSYSNPGTYRIALRTKDNTIPIMTDITYKYVVVLPEPQNIAPRMICPFGDNCNNLKYPASRAIKTDNGNIYVALGGNPYGQRDMIKSTDFGANFSSPVVVPDYLNEPSTQHIGGFDISSTGEIGYAYFDENILDENGWLKLNRSADGTTWDNEESLVNSTVLDFVNNSELVYGASDRMFLIFNMLNKTPAPIRSSIKYLHRLSPQDPFQGTPLTVASSSLPVNQAEFYKPVVAVGDDGQIHVTYIVMLLVTTTRRYSANYARIAADGSTLTRTPVKISQTGTLDSEQFLDIATDGEKIYVAFMQWDTMSQVVDLVLTASEDNGDTWWSTPNTVTDWQIGDINMDHPVSMAIDQDHRIHLVWADNRMSGPTLKRDIWYDYSTDGGLTFHLDRRIYGDGIDGDQGYPSIAIDGLNRINVVWWNDDETASKGVWHTRFIM